MLLTILQGDALEQLRTLPDESVQCCVTSPPYWGLRDYGTASWEGGQQDCEHRAPVESGRNGNKGNSQTHLGRFVNCRCGAVRVDRQLGLERTPEDYVARLVEIFREVRRVLRSDGTLWLNLGDSYANDGKWGGSSGGKHVSELHGNTGIGRGKKKTGLKPKDLVGVPWLVAFALRADGWYLRSDVIWSKPNPMPESVTDRPTKAHEYIFLLSKSQRYYYDANAIQEPVSLSYANDKRPHGVLRQRFYPNSKYVTGGMMELQTGAFPSGQRDETRNKRSVWTVNPKPYSGAHFATYPPDLIKPCILAGSRIGDTILDPFGGSGTTAAVAMELGRKAVLIELNPAYIDLIKRRCSQVTPGLPLEIAT